MDKEFVKTLKQKEKDLQLILEEHVKDFPEYTQLQAIRDAIKAFELNGHSSNINISKTIVKSDAPAEYKNMTWEEKVLFALAIIGEAFVSDIIKELEKYETIPFEKLSRRVTVVTSTLLNRGDIKQVGKEGRRNKVALK